MRYLPIPNLTDSDLQRFWDKVDIAGPNNCWEWTAAKTRGYGRFRIKGKYYYAHRISYALENGGPENFHVCHSCDNPPCVNPAHLWKGTQQDNVDDRVAKGRSATKLTEDDIIAVRGSNEIDRILAERFDVAKATISDIRRGAIWQHIDGKLRTKSDSRKNNKTGVRGVTIHKATGRYRAGFTVEGQEYYVGSFDTIDEALKALAKKREEVGV